MLAQDDFVTPIMSGEGHLRRSSWKAEAIRRGDLKISGPFPINEDTPLSEEEEKEYAEKHQVDPPSLLPDAPSQPTQPPPPPPEPSNEHEPSPPVSDPVEAQSQKQEDNPEPEKKPLSNGVRATSAVPRRNSPEPVSYSSPSPFPSLQDSSARSTPKKKRKSGLRNVFRKMFGRRSRADSREDDGPMSRHGHHRSVCDLNSKRKRMTDITAGAHSIARISKDDKRGNCWAANLRPTSARA